MQNNNEKNIIKKAALISVFDKRNVVECAKALADMGYTILSTGGTYRTLVAHNIDAVSIEKYTGSAEFFDGRVKSLHPKIYAGILARRNSVQDSNILESEELYSIDIVVVNLYPFEKVVRDTSLTHYRAVENIDIGGVALIRAAAKNHESVSVIIDPSDYQNVIKILHDCNTKDVQNIHALKMCNARCAAKAFAHTAHYDAIIANYMLSYTRSVEKREEERESRMAENIEIDEYTVPLRKIQSLRYGENPHQNAQVYKVSTALSKKSVVDAKQLHGRNLSFNNIRDAEAAVRIVHSFSDVCVVAIKHGNPCGVGLGDSVIKAWKKCYASDIVSIFGGIIACNKAIDEMFAKQLSKIFLEIVIAPSFTAEARHILQQKKNLRILTMPLTPQSYKKAISDSQHYSSIFGGGMLMQNYDNGHITEKQCLCVTEKKPRSLQMRDLLFAWNVCKYVKSNAIVIAKNEATLGIGAGQMNRVGAAVIAIEHVQKKNNGATKLKGSVMASDAFFPMSDTVMLAAEHQIDAIIQPGGSIRDTDSIKACNDHGIAMVFTGMRHFLH